MAQTIPMKMGVFAQRFEKAHFNYVLIQKPLLDTIYSFESINCAGVFVSLIH
jgi:hypothetical protein